jgi:hypothetical protein
VSAPAPTTAPAARPRKSWLGANRLKIALAIAVFEGILVAVDKGFTRWTLIIISAPIIAFYIFAGRTLKSRTGRDIAWILAAAQAFAVLLTVVAMLIGTFVLILTGVFAVIAVILLLGERPSRT